MRVQVEIPDNVQFADLRLARDPVTRAISFAWDPIAAVCEASGLGAPLFQSGPEDNVASLIVAWYTRHRELGGEMDMVAEQLIAEVLAEDEYGEVRVQPGGGVQ
jgi:hypothetical protein